MSAMKGDGWHLIEHGGLWWAYRGPTPPPEAFVTHGRRTLNIFGPYASHSMAEALLPKRLGRIEWAEEMNPANRTGDAGLKSD